MQTLSDPRQNGARSAREGRTNVVRLVKHDDRVLAHLLTDLLGDLGVEEIVEGVDHD